MRVTLQHVFLPGDTIGEEGDTVRLLIQPCCNVCFPSVSALLQAFRKLSASVQNHRGIECKILDVNHARIYDTITGLFECIIDYGDLLPHAPESPIQFTLLLEKAWCPQDIAIMELLSLPRGVDDIVRSFNGSGYSLSAEGRLDSSRFILQPIDSSI